MTAEGRLRTIVAATDFSASARIAVRRAAGLAQAHGARLALVHALAPVPALAGADPDFATVPAPDPRALEESARAELEREATELLEQDLEVATILRPGLPPAPVFDVLSEWNADLLVAGTRGLTRFARLLLGSTATRLIRAAPCPVLTVHPEDGPHADPPRNVVIGMDFSPHAEQVMRAARRLVSATPGAVRFALIHALHVPEEIADRPLLHPHPDRLAEARRDALEKLERRANALRGGDREVEVAIREGYPPEVLLDECVDRGADLLALGTRGFSGLRRLVLGSTAARLLPNAPCPVLTVHDTGSEPD